MLIPSGLAASGHWRFKRHSVKHPPGGAYIETTKFSRNPSFGPKHRNPPKFRPETPKPAQISPKFRFAAAPPKFRIKFRETLAQGKPPARHPGGSPNPVDCNVETVIPHAAELRWGCVESICTCTCVGRSPWLLPYVHRASSLLGLALSPLVCRVSRRADARVPAPPGMALGPALRSLLLCVGYRGGLTRVCLPRQVWRSAPPCALSSCVSGIAAG